MVQNHAAECLLMGKYPYAVRMCPSGTMLVSYAATLGSIPGSCIFFLCGLTSDPHSVNTTKPTHIVEYAMTIWQVAGCCASWLCACLHQVHPAHTGEPGPWHPQVSHLPLAALYAAATSQHTQRACHDDVPQCWVLCVVSASGALCTHRRSPSRATRRCRCPIMISAGCTRCRHHQPAHTAGMP